MIAPFCAVQFPGPVSVSSEHCCLAMCPCALGGLGEAALCRSIVLLLFIPSGKKACILSVLKCCDLFVFPPSKQLEMHKLYRLNMARIETFLFPVVESWTW